MRYSGKYTQGQFRNNQFNFLMTLDEREWLFRKVMDLKRSDPDGDHSQNSFVRSQVFPRNLKNELEVFREQQKDLKFTFKAVERKKKNEL